MFGRFLKTLFHRGGLAVSRLPAANGRDKLNARGNACQDQGDHTQAVSWHEQAINADPGHARSYNYLGNALLGMGDPDAAIMNYRRALEIEPGLAEACNNLGLALRAAGRPGEAIAAYQRALDIRPGFAVAHFNIGDTLLATGRGAEAEPHFREAAALEPASAVFHFYLGRTLYDSGDIRAARASFETALGLNDGIAEIHYYLGHVLRAMGRFSAAVSAYQRALQLKPGFVFALNSLGTLYRNTGRAQDAVQVYRRALALEPGHAGLHNNLGLACQDLGEFEQARREFEQAVTCDPGYADACYHLVSLQPTRAGMDRLQSMLQYPCMSADSRAMLHFALGRIHDRERDYPAAFSHFEEANRLAAEKLPFDHPRLVQYIDRCATIFPAACLDQAPGLDSELPVFIVGMPRSGTTLVEQIVSSHSLVYGGGELEHVKFLEHEYCPMPLPGVPPDPRAMAADYLDRIREFSGPAVRVTDKMPDNFLRIGLIKTMFPRARIVHCSRDPMDTCLSIYFHYFSSPVEFACSLTDTGRYYLEYRRAMRHWDAVFGDQIMNVVYEDLVADQERVSRQLIAYLGLEWEDRCLEFHRNRRAVRTASNTQVRVPLYTSSIGAWKNYAGYLEPLRRMLQAAGIYG